MWQEHRESYKTTAGLFLSPYFGRGKGSFWEDLQASIPPCQTNVAQAWAHAQSRQNWQHLASLLAQSTGNRMLGRMFFRLRKRRPQISATQHTVLREVPGWLPRATQISTKAHSFVHSFIHKLGVRKTQREFEPVPGSHLYWVMTSQTRPKGFWWLF